MTLANKSRSKQTDKIVQIPANDWIIGEDKPRCNWPQPGAAANDQKF